MKRIDVFFKSIWKTILGIAAEILLALIFIVAGFMVCLAWWKLIR